MIGYFLRGVTGKSAVRKALQKRFEGVQLGEIVTAAREFPMIKYSKTALLQGFLEFMRRWGMKLRRWRICSPLGPSQWTLVRCSTATLT
jgi:hypothetical protein